MSDFKDRLAHELRAMIPPEVKISAWIYRECAELDIPTGTFKKHLDGDHEPLASVWVKYVQRYGKGFEARVIGESPEPLDDLDALRRRMVRDVDDLIARVPKEGRVS